MPGPERGAHSHTIPAGHAACLVVSTMFQRAPSIMLEPLRGAIPTSRPTPVPDPAPPPPEPVTPDSPNQPEPNLPSYEDEPPVRTVD